MKNKNNKTTYLAFVTLLLDHRIKVQISTSFMSATTHSYARKMAVQYSDSASAEIKRFEGFVTLLLLLDSHFSVGIESI
jgi:hypothetical protein